GLRQLGAAPPAIKALPQLAISGGQLTCPPNRMRLSPTIQAHQQLRQSLGTSTRPKASTNTQSLRGILLLFSSIFTILLFPGGEIGFFVDLVIFLEAPHKSQRAARLALQRSICGRTTIRLEIRLKRGRTGDAAAHLCFCCILVNSHVHIGSNAARPGWSVWITHAFLDVHSDVPTFVLAYFDVWHLGPGGCLLTASYIQVGCADSYVRFTNQWITVIFDWIRLNSDSHRDARTGVHVGAEAPIVPSESSNHPNRGVIGNQHRVSPRRANRDRQHPRLSRSRSVRARLTAEGGCSPHQTK